MGLAQGFAVDGAWGTAKGLWSLASSPLDSARSFGSAVYNYRDTYQALKFGIGDYLNKVQSGDPRAIGLGSFELLTALGPVSKTKYLSKVDNFAPSAKGVGSSFSGAANKIPTIKGRKPINSKYAGQTHPSGVKFNDQGFPNFGPHSKAQVEIDGLSGVSRIDNRLANQAAGFGNSSKAPNGFIWHHVEDGRTMQLVPGDIHNATRHTGGAAIIRNGGLD